MLIQIAEMVKREGDKLSLADDVIDVDQTDFGGAAVQRDPSVISENEYFPFENYLGRSHIAIEAREG